MYILYWIHGFVQLHSQWTLLVGAQIVDSNVKDNRMNNRNEEKKNYEYIDKIKSQVTEKIYEAQNEKRICVVFSTL